MFSWALLQIPSGDMMAAIDEAEQRIKTVTEERDSLTAKLLLALTQGATAADKDRLPSSNPYPENSDTSLFWIVGFTAQLDTHRLRRERDDFRRELQSSKKSLDTTKGVLVEVLEMHLDHGGCCMCGQIPTVVQDNELLCQKHAQGGTPLGNAEIIARARALAGLDK
jgi:hypothetical protein